MVGDLLDHDWVICLNQIKMEEKNELEISKGFDSVEATDK